MAHTSSNCLYYDEHNTDYRNNRTYEFIEVDKETSRKDGRICIFSLGLICNLLVFAMIFFNVIDFTDIQNNHWSSMVRYTCYFILSILTILFIYGIAKSYKFPRSMTTNHNSQDLRENQCHTHQDMEN